MMVRVTLRILTDLLPERLLCNVMQTRVAIYQLKSSTYSCAESQRSGQCLNGSPSTFSYFGQLIHSQLVSKAGRMVGMQTINCLSRILLSYIKS